MNRQTFPARFCRNIPRIPLKKKSPRPPLAAAPPPRAVGKPPQGPRVPAARKGTPAFRWKDDIPEEIKQDRLQRLMRIYEENGEEGNKDVKNTNKRITAIIAIREKMPAVRNIWSRSDLF